MHAMLDLVGMPDVGGFAEINHLFCNIRCVISNAFQTLRRDKKMQATSDVIRIFFHVRDELLLNVLMQRIDFLVAGNQRPRCR